MGGRGAWLKLLGFGVGVAATYGLYRGARRLRAECPPVARPMYADAREMLADLSGYWRHPEEMAHLYRSRLLAHPFAAKVALAALGDGECRMSARLAYLYGVIRGLGITEVRTLLDGETLHATAGETPALLFARHYSRAEGMPNPAMVLELVDAYGEEGANDLLSYLGVLLRVQRAARTLDALIARLVGRPRLDSNLRGELSTVLVALVGVAPFVPVVRWRAVHAPSARPSARSREVPVE